MKKFELKKYICTNFGIICLKFLPILVVPYVSKAVQKCSRWPWKQSKKLFSVKRRTISLEVSTSQLPLLKGSEIILYEILYFPSVLLLFFTL